MKKISISTSRVNDRLYNLLLQYCTFLAKLTRTKVEATEKKADC